MEFLYRIGPAELATTNTKIFTATQASVVSFMSLSNRTAGSLNAFIYLVTPAYTPASSMLIVPGLAVAANDVWPSTWEFLLQAGDALWGYASGAGINLMVTWKKMGD